MTQADLARRALACSRWLWMPGMRWIVQRSAPLDDIWGRVHEVDPARPRDPRLGWTPYPEAVPDLSDPATLGCLLAMYDETRAVLTVPDPVYTMAAAYGLSHPMTIAALVAALEEAAP